MKNVRARVLWRFFGKLALYNAIYTKQSAAEKLTIPLSRAGIGINLFKILRNLSSHRATGYFARYLLPVRAYFSDESSLYIFVRIGINRRSESNEIRRVVLYCRVRVTRV